MRGPQHGLITLLQRALRRLFKSRRGAALRDHHAGNIWRRRRLEHYGRRLARRHAGRALRPHPGILQGDSVDDRRDIARQIRQAHPIDAVSRASVTDDGLPLNKPCRWRFRRAARFRIGTVPAGPLAAGVFRVSRTHKKFQTRVIRLGKRFCRGSRRAVPPLEAARLRKTLRIVGTRFERALGFVLRADRINFSGIRGAQKSFARGIADDARDLHRAGLGEMGEDAVPIDGEERAAVAGTGQEAAIGSESEGVDDIFARRPELFRCALGADAVDAAGDNRRKGDERLLRRSLAGTRYAARSNGCRALRRGDDGAGSLPGTRLLANRGDVDGAVGGDSERSDLTFGSFVENETFGFRRSRIFGVLGGCLRGTPRDAQYAAAGFGAGDETSFCVEGQNSNVSFVAGVEEFTLAVGRDRKDLSFVTGGDVESAVGSEREIPNIFCFGIEENGLLSRSRDPVNLAVGRSADIKSAFGIEADGPKIGSIRVGEQGEFGSEFEAAVAAHRDAMRGAFEEFIVSGLAPAAGVLGKNR